jgi:membrane protein implicated in regulation of membrane protease activity
MTLLWWHWLALGLILIAVELSVAGGFYVMFVGLAALAVGVLTLVGVSGPAGMQLLLFSVLDCLPPGVPQSASPLDEARRTRARRRFSGR